MPACLLRFLVMWSFLGFSAEALSANWSVPVAGNAFRVAPSTDGRDFRRNESLSWGDSDRSYAIFFHVDRPAVLDLALRARVPEGQSTIVARVGKSEFTTSLTGSDFALHSIGQVDVPTAGYLRVEIAGNQRTGDVFAEIRDLVVTSETDGLEMHYVQSNRGNMYYWGRRGPSVHLTYEMPQERKLQYAYSEITVPEGQDVIGSYFMANGFAEGYFGIQVNGPDERRVLFSVWSPFRTDDPRDIPEDQRVALLGKGEEVQAGQFGNEGSGGQSILVYPWKAGVTYCFLTEVKPDGASNTTYTSWFADKQSGTWRLIASFRRPKTDTYLQRFHSFLENFQPAYGHVDRRALYSNVWVGDVDGNWHECTRARFSVDATGRGQHRLDFTGGADGKHFFLRNCGFFNDTGTPGEVFARHSTADQQPTIDFAALPRPNTQPQVRTRNPR